MERHAVDQEPDPQTLPTAFRHLHDHAAHPLRALYRRVRAPLPHLDHEDQGMMQNVAVVLPDQVGGPRRRAMGGDGWGWRVVTMPTSKAGANPEVPSRGATSRISPRRRQKRARQPTADAAGFLACSARHAADRTARPPAAARATPKAGRARRWSAVARLPPSTASSSRLPWAASRRDDDTDRIETWIEGRLVPEADRDGRACRRSQRGDRGPRRGEGASGPSRPGIRSGSVHAKEIAPSAWMSMC